MKQLHILGLASALCMTASVALGDDYKHPQDPRPPGTHEAVKETKVDAKVIGTNITEKVRKDNKDGNVKESPKGGSEKSASGDDKGGGKGGREKTAGADKGGHEKGGAEKGGGGKGE